MSKAPKDEPLNLTPLGKAMTWIERPGSVAKLIVALCIACVVVVLLDLTYDKHGHFEEEEFVGAFAIFGFLAFTAVILGALGLRVLVGTREDYYGTKAVDHEESYPADQIEIKDHADD